MNWPPRWYPVAQEEAGFNLFVAIHGDLWNLLITSWPTSCMVYYVTPGWYEYKPGCGLGYRICQLVSIFDLQPNQATMLSMYLHAPFYKFSNYIVELWMYWPEISHKCSKSQTAFTLCDISSRVVRQESEAHLIQCPEASLESENRGTVTLHK